MSSLATRQHLLSFTPTLADRVQDERSRDNNNQTYSGGNNHPLAASRPANYCFVLFRREDYCRVRPVGGGRLACEFYMRARCCCTNRRVTMNTVTPVRGNSCAALCTDVRFLFLSRHEAVNASLAVL